MNDLIDDLRGLEPDLALGVGVGAVLRRGHQIRRRRRAAVVVGAGATVAVLAASTLSAVGYPGGQESHENLPAGRTSGHTSGPAMISLTGVALSRVDAQCRAQAVATGRPEQGGIGTVYAAADTGAFDVLLYRGGPREALVCAAVPGTRAVELGSGPFLDLEPSAHHPVVNLQTVTTSLGGVDAPAVLVQSGRVRSDVARVTATVGAGRQVPVSMADGWYWLRTAVPRQTTNVATLTAYAADGSVLARITPDVDSWTWEGRDVD